MHADCLPILLADPVGRAVGIVHAGWRGTVVDVAGAAVREMTAAYGTDPGTLLAYLGPAIGAGCYEVGADVASAWTSLAGPADQAVALQAAGECWTFDLAAANAYLLRQAGLRSDHIEASGIKVVGAHEILPELLADEGVIAGRPPLDGECRRGACPGLPPFVRRDVGCGLGLRYIRCG